MTTPWGIFGPAFAVGLLVIWCLTRAAGSKAERPRCGLCGVRLIAGEDGLCAGHAEDRRRRLETERLARVIHLPDRKERLR